MEDMQVAPRLPHGTHRNDVHYNGPCILRDSQQKEKKEQGTELLRATEVDRRTTVIQIAFIPVLKVKNLKECKRLF